MFEIIPALLPKNVVDLKEKLALLPKEIPLIHLDILEEDIWVEMDKDFEVHLMVKDPEAILDRWIKRGARRIIIHSLGNRVSKVPESVEIGLGVEVHAALEEIFSLIPQVDFVHLMSIDNLGTQGDNFEPVIFDRIKKVKEKFPNLVISVDGGISSDNYQRLIDAGANRLVVGSKFEDLWNLLTKK